MAATGTHRRGGLALSGARSLAAAIMLGFPGPASRAYQTNMPSDVRVAQFQQPAYVWTDDGTFHLITTGLVYQTWQTNVWTTNSSPGTGWSPLLEKGPGNTLHLLYKANATNLLYTRKDPGRPWAAPVVAVRIPTSNWVTINPAITGYNYSHDMAVDTDGSVHILWDETYGFMTGTPTDNSGYTNVSFKILYTRCSDPTNPAAWPASPVHDFGKRTDSVAGHDPNQHRSYRRNPFAIAVSNGQVHVVAYSTTPGYVGQWYYYSSTNGASWATSWVANGSHQSSSCEIESDGRGRFYVFYAYSDLRYRILDGTNWSSEQVVPVSSTSIHGLGAEHDHEGNLWVVMARAWNGASDPQSAGYHWPHSYLGGTNGFQIVETNQFSQHQTIYFGVRPRLAADDIWPDPGAVWWVMDNITAPSAGRIRGLTLTGLFAGKPPPGTVILLK